MANPMLDELLEANKRLWEIEQEERNIRITKSRLKAKIEQLTATLSSTPLQP